MRIGQKQEKCKNKKELQKGNRKKERNKITKKRKSEY